MERVSWTKEVPVAMTITDTKGVVLEMNDKAIKGYAANGGKELIGKNMLDCHPEPARSKLVAIMAEQKVNAYTIEKNGVKKLIYQMPWYDEGKYAGYTEISMEIPFDMPHFIRKG